MIFFTPQVCNSSFVFFWLLFVFFILHLIKFNDASAQNCFQSVWPSRDCARLTRVCVYLCDTNMFELSAMDKQKPSLSTKYSHTFWFVRTHMTNKDNNKMYEKRKKKLIRYGQIEMYSCRRHWSQYRFVFVHRYDFCFVFNVFVFDWFDFGF